MFLSPSLQSSKESSKSSSDDGAYGSQSSSDAKALKPIGGGGSSFSTAKALPPIGAGKKTNLAEMNANFVGQLYFIFSFLLSMLFDCVYFMQRRRSRLKMHSKEIKTN